MFGEQQVPVVVKVADDRHVAALIGGAANDFRERCCGLVIVDGDANELRAGVRQGGDLVGGRRRIRSIRVRHRLNDDGICATDRDVPDPGRGGGAAMQRRHVEKATDREARSNVVTTWGASKIYAASTSTGVIGVCATGPRWRFCGA